MFVIHCYVDLANRVTLSFNTAIVTAVATDN